MNDLRALAAATVCTGFSGTEFAPATAGLLQRTPFGGVVLFAENTQTLAQTRKLTDALRAIRPDTIIAIDQEGGRVMRLQDGVAPIPAAADLAATGDEAFVESTAAQAGFDLRRAGVNLDFAPVLDVLSERSTVIGTRSFGSDPQAVTRFGGAFARGLRSQGIVPTFKHFPGHGGTQADSHTDLPVVEADEETVRARDLVPFAKLLPMAQAVMSAHIVLRAFHERRPATLSPRVLTQLLRDELHFQGVCFTDCLEMDAIAKSVGSTAGAVSAVAAGADCVLVSHQTQLALEIVEALAQAVEKGELPRARLEQAAARVRMLQSLLQPPLPLDACLS